MGCVASRAKPGLDEKRALLAQYASEVSTRTKPVDTTQRLAQLRHVMRTCGVDAYVIGSEDAHGSEYTAPCDQRLAFITGFTGSTATAVVCLDGAHFFTDGRYHVQASEQLDDNWTLHKVGEPGVQPWTAWITELPSGTHVGMDAALLPHTLAVRLRAALQAQRKALACPERNLVDEVWGAGRPGPALSYIYEHAIEYAGLDAATKIRDLRQWLAHHHEDAAYVLSALDEVAWLLNLRGASIPCNPVFPAYVVVTADDVALFVDERLLTRPVRVYLAAMGVSLHAYEGIMTWLRDTPLSTILVDERASHALVRAAGESRVVVQTAASPVALAKACKNEVEQDGLRRAYRRDGAAWAKWAAWLEEAMQRGATITERQAADELARVRAADPLYAGMQAYDAISAAGPNAALPHYETPATHSRVLDREAPYLNDSGPQYHDGTIDTTRTVHFGRPSAEQKRAYTRVLQGHIALACARFPAGTTGAQLDMLARQPLFRDGYKYMHGTGHGVGSFLAVHEGPHGLSSSSGGASVPVPLQEGMALSNEPGFYEEGHFGIRIESIVLVRRATTHREFQGPWLELETLTRVPISTRLVDERLLSPAEAQWLRAYNRQCRDELLPLVRGDRRAEKWLRQQ
ncbi:Xaa-Pro aminopeptidase [Malassezia caprae]|uniref:Xaa-Pro aminopeptidase n=1 Tax=Malassezia caprae TaxID=1381934 RepID=A0AAF0E624_9BASI|nr:Xaa-Pro aminopeptidase [Malassezia caprae]